jgi:hypothetical protein
LTRLQVGEDVSRPANLIVSTLSEAEFILPLLEEYKSKGRQVNVSTYLPSYMFLSQNVDFGNTKSR